MASRASPDKILITVIPSGSDFKGGEFNWSVAMMNAAVWRTTTDGRDLFSVQAFLQIHDATDQKQQFDNEVFMCSDRLTDVTCTELKFITPLTVT